MSLQLLPDELLLLVGSNIDEERDINSLARTNRRLHEVINHYLYHHNIRYSKASALAWATEHGKLSTANRVLDQGIPKDAAIQHGLSLALAVRHSHEDMVKRLLELEDMEMPYNAYTSRSVWSVIKTDSESILRLLLQDGRADVNYVALNQMTPLLRASKLKKFNFVEILLESDTIQVNTRGQQGETPLSYAASYGHEKGVNLLLAKGADPNLSPENEHSPLTYAAWAGHHRIVKILLDAGANINHLSSMDRTPLSFAAAGGSIEAVKMLLDAGSEPDSKSIVGSTPLLYAAYSQHEPIIRLLMEHGADPECIDSYFGKSPLLSAAENGDEATVKLLLDHGRVDIERLDEFLKQTPLCYAAINGHAGVVRMLLEKGADPNVGRGYLKRTPLSFAAENGRTAVVEALLEWGVELDTEGQQQSPVFYAAKNGHHGIVILLINRGARPDISDPMMENRAGMEELLLQTRGLNLAGRERS